MTLLEHAETKLIELANQKIRLYGSVILGPAQTEVFLKARPASRMEATDNPRLFRMSRPEARYD